jgi:hypothetical protein
MWSVAAIAHYLNGASGQIGDLVFQAAMAVLFGLAAFLPFRSLDLEEARDGRF